MFGYALEDHHELTPTPSRRYAAVASRLAAALLTLHAAGCTTKSAEPAPRLPQPAISPPAPVAKFRGRTLLELREAVRKMFGEGPFQPGQTLEDTPNAGTVDITEDMPGKLVLAFKKAGLEQPRSPVIAHEAASGAVRFIQLGPEGEDRVSLVAGRNAGTDKVPNDVVYRIEARWVQRLVEWDTCTRSVAGETEPASPCGSQGCPILVTRQRFVHPSGEIESLLFELSEGETEAVIKDHSENHVRKSKHCKQSTDATGKCTLDCERTAK